MVNRCQVMNCKMIAKTARIILRCMKNDTSILKLIIYRAFSSFTLIFQKFLLIMMIDDDINMAPEIKVKPLI